jgi:DNA-binding response OmpR family regulator
MAYKLLLADDEKETAEILQKRLIKEGYEVTVAFDGEDALLKIRDSNPDVILLDLDMPKRNGYEVLKEVREKFKDKWRPVIIFTGKGGIEALEKCYDMEADHYLTKPCNMEAILQAIRTMISLIPARAKV